MKGILLRIQELLDDINPSERRVGEYILKHSSSIVGQPVSELASNSDTNRAAIIRFCKSIGCTGYRDFTFQLAAELAISKSETGDEYTDVNIGDSVESIYKNVCYNNVKAIEDSCSLINADDVARATEVLIKASRIDFYGLGASWIVAQDAQYKFMRINKNCTAYADTHIQLTSAVTLTNKDVAVAISWSGETKDIIEAAECARERGATIIAITKCGKNRLSEVADINFYLSSPETSIRCGAMSSRISQMTMIDILYSSVVSKDYKRIRHYLENSRPIGQGKRYHYS